MKYILLAVLLAATTLHAQTAKVIQLSPEDAALAKSLAEQKAAIVQKMDELQKKITDKYLSEDVVYPSTASGCIYLTGQKPCTPPPPPKPTPEQLKASHVREVKVGWYGGFVYSEDYKFIVPAVQVNTGTVYPNWITNGNGVVLNQNIAY